MKLAITKGSEMKVTKDEMLVKYAAMAKAFDDWYSESSHMCELLDKVNAGKISDGEVNQLELLRNLLNASINANNAAKIWNPQTGRTNKCEVNGCAVGYPHSHETDLSAS